MSGISKTEAYETYKRKGSPSVKAEILSTTKDGLFVIYRCLHQYDMGDQTSRTDTFLDDYEANK